MTRKEEKTLKVPPELHEEITQLKDHFSEKYKNFVSYSMTVALLTTEYKRINALEYQVKKMVDLILNEHLDEIISKTINKTINETIEMLLEAKKLKGV